MKTKDSTKPLNVFHEAELVCKAIHGEDSFTLLAFKRENDGHHVGDYGPPQYTHATYTQQAKKFSQYQARGLEPFVAAGYMDGEGHGNANVEHTWALAIDFDGDFPACLKNNPLLAPSLLIETSPGHYHAIWVLDALCPKELATKVLKAMTIRLGGDLAFAKPSQFIRLPGFVNAKRGFISRLVETSNLRKTFSIDFLCQAFDVDFICNSIHCAVPRMDRSLNVPRLDDRESDVNQIIADLDSALPYLKEYADVYMDWVSTLMALVPLGNKGKILAEQFSRFSSKFDAHAFEIKWQQLQNNPGSVATLFLRAQLKGWRNPGFRPGFDISDQTLPERDFGRMIAEELGDTFAVIPSGNGENAKPIFLAWNGDYYRELTDIEKRATVEKAGKTVISRLTDRKLSKEVASRLAHHIGKKRTLNVACDDVAEALIPLSQKRALNGYPYFWVANGVLNLLTQELVSSVFKPVPYGGRSPVVFDPDATAPIFEKTIREIFEYDEELVSYVLRLFGYMLLGKPKEQIFAIFFGPKAENGKTMLLELIMQILGTYAGILPSSSILLKSHVTDGATPSTAQLEGKRLAVVSETSDHKHAIDSAAVKQMTGDRYLPVRKMYEDPKTILVEFLLVMSTNHLPKISSEDNGLWRRIRIVPFNRTFSGKDNNRDLFDQLNREKSGILNLMLAGLRDYLLQDELQTPKKVMALGAEQRHAVDPVAQFVEDMLKTVPGKETPLKTLYPLYETWQKENPLFIPLTKRQLQKKLEDNGFKRIERGNLPYYCGLSPITTQEA